MSWGTRPGGTGDVDGIAWPRLGREAAAAVALTALFIALTCWWLSRDRRCPTATPASTS